MGSLSTCVTKVIVDLNKIRVDLLPSSYAIGLIFSNDAAKSHSENTEASRVFLYAQASRSAASAVN